MNEIKCPHCGEVFKVDASGYADIVKQVRDAEFSHDLDERVKAVQREGEQALELERSRLASALQEAESQRNAQLVEQKNAAAQELAQEVAKRDAELAELRAKLEGAAAERESASQRAAVEACADAQKEKAELQREIDNLRAQLGRKDDEAKLAEAAVRNAAQNDLSARDAQIAELQAKLSAADKAQEMALAAAAAESQRELAAARSEAERTLADYQAKVKEKFSAAKAQSEQEAEGLRAQLREQELTAKMNLSEAVAAAERERDFIFRECDASGNEIISIMFEMKNENDETATKHKNEDFFKKLDHDRRQKGCEYAVLCTLLEPESELYNAGIVDVSYRYEKMYVIRPQFFIPMITLLRNAAMGSLRYKQELAEYKQQNIDVTNFEAKMEKFKDGFSRNYNLASKQFESAIKEIDAAIKQLEKTKDDLRRSTENLRLAHNKADELTIRKLTWGNKTMKAAFDEARETATGTGDEPAEADSYEVEDAE